MGASYEDEMAPDLEANIPVPAPAGGRRGCTDGSKSSQVNPTDDLDPSLSHVRGTPAPRDVSTTSTVPSYWACFSWWPMSRPWYLVWLILLGALALLAGGLAGIVIGGQSECEAQQSQVLSQYGYVVDRIQEQVAIRTVPLISLGTFVRQTPYFPALNETFASVAADLLEHESAVENLQLAPAGVVSALYPFQPGPIGHNLWVDPLRRPDSIKTVEVAPGISISNPVQLLRKGQSGNYAVFARYAIFVDGPVENRTEAFGFADATNCTDLCYGNPDKVYWGFSTALINFDDLLAATGITALEASGACFVLRTHSNTTIYNSTCTASNPATIPVDLHSTRWSLEICYREECMSWVVPAAVAFSLGMATLLMITLYSAHQSLKNSVLMQLRHESEIRHLRDRQEQAVREEATAGSDAIRWLVTRFCQAMALPSSQIWSMLDSASVSASGPLVRFLHGDSFLGRSSKHSGFIVVARVWNLSLIQATDPAASRLMLDEILHIVENIAQEHSGQQLDTGSHSTGRYFVQFQEISKAVAFALKLRRELMEAPWPKTVLALPGCGQQQLSVSFQRASGPQLQMLVDCDTTGDVDCPADQLCRAAAPPRHILITGPAMVKLAVPRNLMVSGYPDIKHLGTFTFQGSRPHVLLRINDPIWDLRLPQVPDAKLPAALTQVRAPEANLWAMPGTPGRKSIAIGAEAVVSMTLQQRSSSAVVPNGGQEPLGSVQARLDATANAMCLLFGGSNMQLGRSWSTAPPVMVAFPDVDSAISFSACFQHTLLHTQWSEQELEEWGGRETGHLGKLAFAGPRVKTAIDLYPQGYLSRSAKDDTSHWGCVRLLEISHGGQILISGKAFETSGIASQVEKVRIIDRGVHSLDGAVSNSTGELERTDVKEVQLADVARRFPPLATYKELSPGFDDSPDPCLPSAFVFCSASCPGGAKVASSPAFLDVLKAWQADFRYLLSRFGGYELQYVDTAMGAVFPTHEASLVFCTEMQERLLSMPVAEELLARDGFSTLSDAEGGTLFSGLRVKAGISFGIPEMRRLVPSTGRAAYKGVVVQRAAQLMVMACPGQVIVDAEGIMQTFRIPATPFKNTLVDRVSEPIAVSNAALIAAGCPSLLVRVLGYFKVEGRSGIVHRPLADIVTPALAGRTFTPPPGRVGTQSIDNGGLEECPLQTPVSTGAVGEGKSQKIASMMYDMLQQRQSAKPAAGTEEVQVMGILGQGQQGRVMLGRWKGADVAYKVIQLPVQMSKQDTTEARALLEMAISATMAHPHVVQTYSYEMAYIPGAAMGRPSLEALNATATEEQCGSTKILEDAATSVVERHNSGQSAYQEARLIQELCDMGSLRYNLDNQTLCSEGDTFPHVGLMLMLAHDVASGLQHIHSQNIVHGDLKALNVLLCSSTRKVPYTDTKLPKAVAKVSDFGLSARLTSDETHISNVHCGTVTHMAPEILLAGKLSKSADVYAFGMLLFEMFSGERVFGGMNMPQIIHAVGTKGMRPHFPPSVPVQIMELAGRCWGPADSRPSFDDIVRTLNALSKNRGVQRHVSVAAERIESPELWWEGSIKGQAKPSLSYRSKQHWPVAI